LLALSALVARDASATAYDLQADLAARRAELAARYAEATPSSVVERVFLVSTPGSKGRALARRAARLARRALAAYFGGRFETRPSRAVSVFVFASGEGYERFCQDRWATPCPSRLGFYDDVARAVVVNVERGMGTLVHELVHPVLEDDFPGAPHWLHEGIASLYEHAAFSRPGEIHGLVNFRLPVLTRALRTSETERRASLAALVELTDAAFHDEHEALHYALARYACQWLEAEGLLWPLYRELRTSVGRDESVTQTFARVVGHTPAEADTPFRQWVLSLGGQNAHPP
jgi:hypothetical protein